jgi:transcription elongation factor Elf1
MIRLKKKKIPKKPFNLYNIKLNTYGNCPNCGHSGLKEITHEHCWWCGQKLDWSDNGGD